MKLRKLMELCIHDRCSAHWILDPEDERGGEMCLGGVFLPDDTLVIERAAAFQIVADQDFTVQERQGRHLNGGWHYLTEDEINALLDALSVRETE